MPNQKWKLNLKTGLDGLDINFTNILQKRLFANFHSTKNYKHKL